MHKETLIGWCFRDMSRQGAMRVVRAAIDQCKAVYCEPLPGDNCQVGLRDEAGHQELLEETAKAFPVQEAE